MWVIVKSRPRQFLPRLRPLLIYNMKKHILDGNETLASLCSACEPVFLQPLASRKEARSPAAPHRSNAERGRPDRPDFRRDSVSC
jgi:hypothetical protein